MGQPASAYEVVEGSGKTHVRFAVVPERDLYIPNHWHHAIEVLYLLQGEMEVTLAGAHTHLAPGGCLLINSRLPHATQSRGDCRVVMLQVPDDFWAGYLPDAQNIFFAWEGKTPQKSAAMAALTGILVRMAQLYENPPQGYLLEFNGLLFEFLFRLARDFRIPTPAAASGQRMRELRSLEPALRYTEANCARAIPLAEIAGVAGFRPEYFCRLFRRCMGITYLQYLNELRLSRVYRDLLATDLPVHTLLERHGFTNYKLFCRMFRAHFRDTPSAVRRTMRALPPQEQELFALARAVWTEAAPPANEPASV
jgi:AraC-like DNA-binding protein/mannose-6-phosphate isomerase-like protein (cupin superfamily)